MPGGSPTTRGSEARRASALGNYANNLAPAGQGIDLGTWDLMRWLWANSSLQGLRKCHRVPYGSAVRVYLAAEHLSFEGLCRCSSVWACPLCAPSIRKARAQELAGALVGYMQRGGGVAFATFTVPHDYGMDLRVLFGVVATSWAKVLADKSVRNLRKRQPFEFVRAAEVTFGANGFHPHLHVGLIFAAPLSREDAIEFHAVLYRAWCSAVERAGLRRPSTQNGVSFERIITDVAAGNVGEYVTKHVDGLADELTRLDGKSAKNKGLSPFGLLRMAATEHSYYRWAWREFERGSLGRRALTWSNPARAVLRLTREWTDLEALDAAAAAEPRVPVGELSYREWSLVAHHPAGVEMLTAGLVAGLADGLATADGLRGAMAMVHGTLPSWCLPSGHMDKAFFEERERALLDHDHAQYLATFVGGQGDLFSVEEEF